MMPRDLKLDAEIISSEFIKNIEIEKVVYRF